MSIVLIDRNIDCDTVNRFMSVNISNVDCIIIDSSLFINELIAIGSISTSDPLGSFNVLRSKIFNNEFFNNKDSISSIQMVDEIINHIYEEDVDSFLLGAFLYDIPVFIDGCEVFNDGKSTHIYIDSNLDIKFLTYAKSKYDLDESYLINYYDDNHTLLGLYNKTISVVMKKKMIYEGQLLDDKSHVGSLYDELIGTI